MGVVSVLYGLLMQGAPERPTMLRSASKENVGGAVAVVTTTEEAEISDYTLSVALAVMKDKSRYYKSKNLSIKQKIRHFNTYVMYVLWYYSTTVSSGP